MIKKGETMNMSESILNFLDHAVKKSVTVGLTYIVANDGLNVIFGYFFGQPAVNLIEVKLLLLGTALAITQNGIVPVIEGAISAIKGEKTTEAEIEESKFNILKF
jgi:hypothetical protein